MQANETSQIAAKVRGIKAETQKTDTDLAAILGIDRKSVGARMNGRVPFTASEVWRLACSLGKPVSQFFPSPVVSTGPEPVEPAGASSIGGAA